MCRGKNSQRLNEDEQTIQSAVKNAEIAVDPTLSAPKHPEVEGKCCWEPELNAIK